MICIAAFIVLCLMSVVVAFLSIFKRDLWAKYVKIFKKSWSCFGKRITLQKCETGFGDDVKNGVLSRVALKNAKLVKPASIAIEVASILVVFIVVWSVVEAGKAGLALWTLGTCNVKQPSSCALGAEACSIDEVSGETGFFASVGSWFTDWGEIFGAIPDKFRSWEVEQFDLAYIEMGSGEELAIDIMDPQCIVCSESFKAQIEDGFFEKYSVRLVLFPIESGENEYKFPFSRQIVELIFAAADAETPKSFMPRNGNVSTPAAEMIYRIYMENREDGQVYFDYFSYARNAEVVMEELRTWLQEFGFSDTEIVDIEERAKGDEIAEKIRKNNDIVINNIHAKGIPTSIYSGRKHNGKYEN